MTFREIRDHKFKLLFTYFILQGDIEELFLTYFDNIPYEEDEDINSYTGDSKSHTSIHKIKVNDEKELELTIDEEHTIEDIKNKVRDIILKTNDIDLLIKKNLATWDIQRVGKAELTIIRLAIYEMYFDKSIDVPVAINEAVELAKVYGDEKADKFVNGVLATVFNSENLR